MKSLLRAIFYYALEDVYPEKLEEFNKPFWVNAWAITLDCEQWEINGLFEPESNPRCLKKMTKMIRGIFKPTSSFKRFDALLRRKISRMFGKRIAYFIRDKLINMLVKGKSSLDRKPFLRKFSSINPNIAD